MDEELPLIQQPKVFTDSELLAQIARNTEETRRWAGWIVAILVLSIIAGAVLVIIAGDSSGTSSGF